MRSPNKLNRFPARGRRPVGHRAKAVFWDLNLSGFGVRVHPSGSKVYMVHTRAQGIPTRHQSAAMRCGRPSGHAAWREGWLNASRRVRRRTGRMRTRLGQRADDR